jgi:uncharacterized protein
LSLDEDLGRAFLYVRYNVELTEKGLKELGIGSEINAAQMRKMDDVRNMPALTTIGERLGAKVDLSHLGPFAPGAAPNA